MQTLSYQTQSMRPGSPAARPHAWQVPSPVVAGCASIAPAAGSFDLTAVNDGSSRLPEHPT